MAARRRSPKKTSGKGQLPLRFSPIPIREFERLKKIIKYQNPTSLVRNPFVRLHFESLLQKIQRAKNTENLSITAEEQAAFEVQKFNLKDLHGFREGDPGGGQKDIDLFRRKLQEIQDLKGK